MHTFTVTGRDITSAWIAACNALDRKHSTDRTGFHTVVRITDPARDDLRFRTELDRLRTARGHEAVETVAATLFPAALAATCPDHAALVARYRAMYDRLKKYPGNTHGTYFGRLVSYPGRKQPEFDQLGHIIERLRTQAASRGPMTAAYEADLVHPGDQEPSLPAEAAVHTPGQDNLYRGFPCLSHLSFQLSREGRVHATALYRSHYMVERAYGNYLGLGRLLAYVAAQAQLMPGSLTVVAGHAQLDGPVTALRPLLSGTAPLVA
ncbi:hypothetical protein [Streptomyces paromomycinus]|uniref:Thymidylate synthase n=1 Tax=Streptomyces paromomycinus TaxID=92743 RepID=A0A401VTR5_STREY|nr:hypothetical protein [Streptomyces paromomycinus]GCD40399.1 hypothetical protein GKJPGBOP_00048 [Streptomyces paromomycinus]